MLRSVFVRASAVLAGTLAVGCLVGPKYQVPPAPVPHRAQYKESSTWKRAAPADAIPRGPWWAMFGEAELDALQQRLSASNQSIMAAAASYRAARAQIRVAEARYLPTVAFVPSTTRGYSPGVGSTIAGGATMAGAGTRGPFQTYVVAAEASWAPDLFGTVRYDVRQRRYTAQASAAGLESTRLLLHATLALTYFQLRGQDALQELLDATVTTNGEILELIRSRFDGGLENDGTLVQAEQTLEASRVQATNAGVLRAQYEHAIATLLGVPATDFALPQRPLLAAPPSIPAGAPSELLERRPDIAAAERRMAAANAAVGLGYAAYYPTITLTGTLGVASRSLGSLFDWPSRLWAVGTSLVETIFDGGARGANIDALKAQYDANVADYRQTVLVAFQEVEDLLAQTRILASVVERQRAVVALAERGLELERARYEAGLDPYITLMTEQTAVLGARQFLVNLEVQRSVAAVQLVQALGGGWNRSDLPED